MAGSAPLSGLTVTTPWYPSLHNSVGGSFVTDWTGLARSLTDRIRIVHAEEWPGGDVATVAGLRGSADRVLGRMAARGELDVHGRWSRLTRVPTIITAGFDVADRAEAGVESTRAFGGVLDTPVVHGHVGYLGGLTAARLASPESRVVVTEHSTGLGDFLSTPRGRDMYTEVLERAHRLTCVSGVVRDLILTACPGHDDTVVVLPNPVDFAPVHQRSDPVESLDHWVFSGGLIERKGVVRLVRAFTRFASGRPAATLDLYGQGPLEDELRTIGREAGVEDRIRFRGNVTHNEMLSALAKYDVLIAPSHYETFHLVVPEAVAAGIPVVVTRSGGPQEALAGVEDLVGRFIDVNEDPDELTAAVDDLERGLTGLDLPRAREILGARYGHEAMRSSLAELYGCADSRLATDLEPLTPEAPEHVIISVSGWRRYAVAAAVSSLTLAHAPTRLLTGDPTLADAHSAIHAGHPAAYVRGLAEMHGLDAGLVARTPRVQTAVAARAAAGMVRTAVRDSTSPSDRLRGVLRTVPRVTRRLGGGAKQDLRALRRAAADARRRRGPDGLAPSSGSPSDAPPVHVVADVASFPVVASLLDVEPAVRLATEPDRRLLGLTPVDVP